MRCEKYVTKSLALLALLTIVIHWGIAPVPEAEALLFVQENDDGEKIVFDDRTGYSWYWSIKDFAPQTYTQQLDSITALNTGSGYYGLTNWTMASKVDIKKLLAYSEEEIGGAFYRTHEYPWGTIAWEGRINTPGTAPDSHLMLDLWQNKGNWRHVLHEPEGVSDDDPFMGAWVLNESPVVPEPGTMVLMGIGLFGFVAFRRKLMKKS